LESAILFATEGANVVLADINLAAADKAKELVDKAAPNAQTLVFKADVAKEKDIKELVDVTVSRFGRLDVMFNNAGEPSHPLEYADASH
jgi:NAD(P)-dependent dehydrogenase (short-subunit alcohol dehydrogenase family)